jgi:hypothetical protein
MLHENEIGNVKIYFWVFCFKENKESGSMSWIVYSLRYDNVWSVE